MKPSTLITGLVTGMAAAAITLFASPASADDQQKLNKYYQLGVSSIEQGLMEQARKQFEIGCELDDDMNSCFTLATMYSAGVGGPQDKAKAEKSYKALCLRGMDQACDKLDKAISQAPDQNAPPGLDPLAQATLEQQCDDDVLRACLQLGASHGRGITAERTVNFGRAKHYYIKACDGGLGEACSNLSLMAYAGEGGPQDPAASRAFAKRSCDLNNINGCANYSALLQGGIGGDVDLVTARRAAQFACEGNSMPGCVNYGQMLIRAEGGPADPDAARTAFAISCEQNNPLACNNLGALFADGQGGPTDREKALELFKKSCAGGYERACGNITIIEKEISEN